MITEELTIAEGERQHVLCIPYVKRLPKKIDKVCMSINNQVPDERRKGVIYVIPCGECEYVHVRVYVGDIGGGMLMNWISKHRPALSNELT